MSGKLRVLISALLLTPAVALGLGLGEIRLNSALNQPLSAEIDLVAATPEELAALEANLASSDVFARYGLDRPAYLNSLEFTVGRGKDGRSVLLVRSRDAISEPFVSFLVDVNWPRGRLLREYTVLLDPPAMLSASESPAAAPIAAPVTTAPVAPPRPAPRGDGSCTRRRRLRRSRRRLRPSRPARLTKSSAATRCTASPETFPAAAARRYSAP